MRTFAGLAAAVSLSMAGQAHALVAFSIGAVGSADPGFAPGEVEVVGFDTPTAPGIVETDSGPADSVGLFTLTDVNVAAAPVGDTSMFQAVQPGGSAKFDFTNYAPGVGSLSVYVGSIDVYNKFEVTTNLRTYYYDGTDFLHNDGDEFSHFTNRRVYFQFDPSEIFESITFSSSGIAFEYDSIAAEPYPGAQPPWVPTGDDIEILNPTSIPEPAVWALMLVGCGLVGSSARRRRSAPAL